MNFISNHFTFGPSQYHEAVSLKVVSSENYGRSKIAPIVTYWPGTVALGIILNFFFPSSRMGHISVSGQYSEINR
jgi:hypothetical protein